MGFFEWRSEAGHKQPYYFRRRDERLFAFAGLWSSAEGAELPSFVILTTQPNEIVEPYHNRMPVMLSAEAARTWVQTSFSQEPRLRSMLASSPANEMVGFAVGRDVNSPRHNDKNCIEPLSWSIKGVEG